MHIVDQKIKNNIGSFNIQDYLNVDKRNEFRPKIADVVNSEISKVPSIHSTEHEEQLRRDGYITLENFLSVDEVEILKDKLNNTAGYNTHVPKYSDGITRKLSPEYPYNTLSYPPNPLLTTPFILDKITDPYILSLSQAYLGCFPTLYSLNAWWHFFKGDVYGTQRNHRDHDDFRFLALFIYLTDVDEETGPHVFYPGTQDGSESDDAIAICGGAGNAILADTFAIHRGQPLMRDSRLVCWWRYGMYLNDMHFHDGNNNFKVSKEDIFNHLPVTDNNEYLFRAFN